MLVGCSLKSRGAEGHDRTNVIGVKDFNSVVCHAVIRARLPIQSCGMPHKPEGCSVVMEYKLGSRIQTAWITGTLVHCFGNYLSVVGLSVCEPCDSQGANPATGYNFRSPLNLSTASIHHRVSFWPRPRVFRPAHAQISPQSASLC